MFCKLEMLVAGVAALAAVGGVHAHEHEHMLARRDIASETASTSYPLPSIVNSFTKTSPGFSQGPGENLAAGIGSALDWGRLTDWSNPWSIYRDGGGSCTLGNRTFWFFDDTEAYAADGSFAGFASNSLAVANSFNHLGWLTDVTVNKSTGVFPAIPFTASEYVVRNSQTSRYAIWTYTNCVEVSRTEAAHFWQVVKYTAANEYSTIGVTQAYYTLDEAANRLSVERPKQLYLDNTVYEYGAFGNIVIDGYAYLYGLDTIYSSRYDVHVARAPLTSIKDQSTWQYYDASTGTWSSTITHPSARRRSAAVIQGTMPFSSGAFFFSQYHNQYCLVFFNNWIDSTFRILFADTPVGPWDTNNKVLYKSDKGPKGYNYGGLATPIYFQRDGHIAGQRLMLSYSYQDSDGTYPRTHEVVFN
ncbi:uncharacterized protein V1510DRAFT_404127 [Dipodascopsis tothii]|uniref:uncharacterized protein n=1 Tax=Dipodascopsis tothii TaxID=44089 RepID=UPI0034CD03D1